MFPGSSIGSSGWLLTSRLQVRVLPGEPDNQRRTVGSVFSISGCLIWILRKAIPSFICSLLFFIPAAHGIETDRFLAYTMKTFDYNQDGVVIKLKYPEVAGINRQYRSINGQIRKNVLTIRFPGKATSQSFGEQKDFVQGIKRFIMRNNFKGYEFSSAADVVHNAGSIFTVKIICYEMPYGAANGLNSLTYLNFDAGTGKRLDINDCFSDPGRQELARRGKEFFVEKARADDVLDLLDNQFLDKFYLPENFAVTDRGIEFAYQQYEAGPRPLGMPSFTIPHGEMQRLIDKGCALRQYLYK